MVKRNTRSSRNKQRSAPTENERELNDSVNVSASEADIEASGAAATQTETESPTGRSPALKIKQAKKKTSAIWKHFKDIFVEENIDDMVIKKPMAACKYCDDVLPAPSNQDQRGVAIRNDKAEQDEGDHVDGIAAHTIVDQEEI